MRAINKLTALQVQRLKVPGRYGDGGGLWLHVTPAGSKSWVLRYMLRGTPREMGLGAVRDVDLERARELARDARGKLRDGLDPIDVRETERTAARAVLMSTKSFEWCAEEYVTKVKVPELSNTKHAAQWGSTLKAYAYPRLGQMPVDKITIHDVYAALADIWLKKNETATRVRQRIEAVWAWAKVQGYCHGDNPAAWKGGLEMLFPKPSKVQEDEHHAALPYAHMGAFIKELHAVQATARKYKRSIASSMALEFAILTAQRTNPIITMEWDEIDFHKRVWVSPAEHMKGQYPHRVPLSARAIEILETMRAQRDGQLVFQHEAKGLHSTSMLGVVQNMDERTPNLWVDPRQSNRRVTPHGFRSSFRDWTAEVGTYEDKACELALAHTEKNQTVAAYLRGDMLAKRRPIMDDWAAFCLKA